LTLKRPIEAVLEDHADELTSLTGVVGTAIGEDRGEPCIKVFLATDDENVRESIPRVLEGYGVVVEQTGEIRALSERESP
jgi:hypothetical protein